MSVVSVVSPPDPPPRREEPMESISSMKMMEGACSLAITNSSLTCTQTTTMTSYTQPMTSYTQGMQPHHTCRARPHHSPHHTHLTIRDPSPMYFCTSSEPETRMKQHSVWWATALASRVLPVPGGPYNKTP